MKEAGEAGAIEPIQELKVRFLGGNNPRLHTDEVLIALALASVSDPDARKPWSRLPHLRRLFRYILR